MIRLSLLVLSVSTLPAQSTFDYPTRVKSWDEIEHGCKALRFAPGWKFYPSQRGKDSSQPYIVAAKESHRRRNRAYHVTRKNIGAFLAPQKTTDGRNVKVPNAAAAAELLRFLYTWRLVEDRKLGKRLRAAAALCKPKCPHWGVKIDEERVSKYGAHAVSNGNRYDATAVFYVDFARLGLLEVKADIGSDGSIEVQERWVVTGPPTFWSVAFLADASDEDYKNFDRKQKEMKAEVALCKRRFAQALDVRRSISYLRELCKGDLQMAKVVDSLGPPERNVSGGGIDRFVYELHDGTEVVFGGKLDVRFVHHTRAPHTRRDGGGKVLEGSVIEKLR